MTAKGTPRTPLYGTSTKGRTVQVQGYISIPAVPRPCTPHVPTGYHLTAPSDLYGVAGWRSMRLLSLALRRYVLVLSGRQLRHLAISVVRNPGFCIMNSASWCCAGLATVISRALLRLSLLKTIDWRRPLFPLLQAQHAVTRLSRSSVPPSASATLWSTSRHTFGANCPQYRQVKLSRARISQRSLYHPFNSIRFSISILYSTGGATASVVAYPCTV